MIIGGGKKMPPKTITINVPHAWRLDSYVRRTFARGEDFINRRGTRHRDWHLAVESILRSDVAGLSGALQRINDVNAQLNRCTLLQIALMGAFPDIAVPPAFDDEDGSRPEFDGLEYDAGALDRGLACMRALFDRGADPNRTYCDVPPLAFAIVRGIGPALRLLIKRGAMWQPFAIQSHTRNYEWPTMYHIMHTASQISEECSEVLEEYRCKWCRQQLATKRCEKCMLVRYCCIDCQISDRPHHRAECYAAPPPTRMRRRPLLERFNAGTGTWEAQS